jgi:YbbR domain-containing protein
MKRLVNFLVRNWPLKLAAVTMSVLLYGGLVLSENAQAFEGRIPIEGINQPESVVLVSNLGDVRIVRYFAPAAAGVRLDSSFFRATVDLSELDPRSGLSSAAVKVVAIDPRIQVTDWEPSRINVQLEEVVTRTVPVRVDWGVVPPGLDVREPVVAVESVSVAGPASVVRRVAAAVARLRIDPSGLDVDRDVELVPVDELGNPLTPIEVAPTSVQVRIAVFTDRQTKSVPVAPVVSGTPAAGYEIATVSVEPRVVSVEGDADQLASLTRLDTVPVSVAGSSSSVNVVTDLSLPTGVLPLGQPTVTVRITLRQVAATRTLAAGVVLTGAHGDLVYALGTNQVLVTAGGTAAALDRIAGASFTVAVDVSRLTGGTAVLPVALTLPEGITLISVNPGTVSVTASPAAPGPTPTSPPVTPAPTPTGAASPASSPPP